MGRSKKQQYEVLAWEAICIGGQDGSIEIPETIFIGTKDECKQFIKRCPRPDNIPDLDEYFGEPVITGYTIQKFQPEEES